MFEQTKAVMFDLDGTIYYGSKIIDGANAAIEHCRNLGKRVYFLTNNSTKTRQQIFERLQGMGVSCTLEEVLTSGYVATLYAKREGLQNIYLCGSANLAAEFENLGISVASPETAESMLIGYDPEFSYEKLTQAVRVAKRARIILACNKEKTYLGEGAQLFPGCGGMVAPIEWCAERPCDYTIGKPNTLMLDIVCEQLGLEAEQIMMVGDTYESDILMANKKGCPSILIGTRHYADTVTVEHIGDLVNLVR